jgi:hypothetical protein
MQFGQFFKLLRLGAPDHGFVINVPCARFLCPSDGEPAFSTFRLITSFGTARTHQVESPGSRGRLLCNRPASATQAAAFSPELARRFPFFAALKTRREVFFPASGTGKWGKCQMKNKASGRSALIVATLFVCFAGPIFATTGAEGAAGAKSATKHVKHGSRHGKSYAHRKSGKVAFRSFAARKAAAADAADDDDKELPPISPSVANANAQLASADPTPGADTLAGKARAMIARANDILQASAANAPAGSEGQVVAADQLNDVDRATPTRNLVMASTEAPPAAAPAQPAPPPAAAASNSNEKSTWGQTSLIGKIFIGFGALLTMASAARMFMA